MPDQSHIHSSHESEPKYDLWRNVARYGSSVTRQHLQFCAREWARLALTLDPLYFSVFCPYGIALHRQALGQMQTDEITELRHRELACLKATNRKGNEYYSAKLKSYGPIFCNVTNWKSLFPSWIRGPMVDARLSVTGNDLYIMLPQNCLATNLTLIHPKAKDYKIHPSVNVYTQPPPEDIESDDGSQVSMDAMPHTGWNTTFTYDYSHPLDTATAQSVITETHHFAQTVSVFSIGAILMSLIP